jgi:hypothetical protein
MTKILRITAITDLLYMAVLAAALADQQITDRAPQPDEIGYCPADGAIARLNPPSFIWLHEPQAHTYTMQWAVAADFRDAVTVTNFTWNTYTHHVPLAPGRYYWRYRFETKDRQTSNWSATRSVTVPPDAAEFPMPTRAQQRDRIPQGHPRLFMRPEDLPRLRAAAQGKEADRFAKLRAEADRYIVAGPTPEPAHLGSARDKDNKELVKYWWPNREQTMRACQEAETIALVYLMTGEEKYSEAARRWVLHLTAWNPDGPTNFRLNCEAAKPLLYRLPRAYDWAFAALSEADRQTVRQIMRRRTQDAWESGEVQRGVGHLNRPFSSHGNRTWHKLGECAIAFLGELPEAEIWLDYAVNKFYACYPVWSDDDGGWHEGVSYWAGYMSKAVWWLQVAESALKIDGLKKPFFDQVGDFPLYVAPPGSPNEGFGDLSHGRPSPGWGGFMDYFIRAKGHVVAADRRPPHSFGREGGERHQSSASYRASDQREGSGARQSPATPGAHAAYWRWWAEHWGMKGQDGVLGFLYAANLPPLPAAKPPTDLPVS